MPAPTRFAAFLRAVNLGPANRVPMALLRDLAASLGFEGVATHGMSGNLVLTAPTRSAGRVDRALASALEGAVGFPVPVVVRTRAELAAVLADDPFGDLATDPARHVVVLLAAPVDPAAVRAGLPGDTSPEAVHVTDRHIHVWCPDGVSRSAVLAALSRARGPATTGTVRNRRTLEAVAALLDGRR